ncbi:MAG: hypothetical protein NTX25_06785 [Proteobacteria bacterium]|nr:hypothetical protein [Pseudomonadota bacterium]
MNGRINKFVSLNAWLFCLAVMNFSCGKDGGFFGSSKKSSQAPKAQDSLQAFAFAEFDLDRFRTALLAKSIDDITQWIIDCLNNPALSSEPELTQESLENMKDRQDAIVDKFSHFASFGDLLEAEDELKNQPAAEGAEESDASDGTNPPDPVDSGDDPDEDLEFYFALLGSDLTCTKSKVGSCTAFPVTYDKSSCDQSGKKIVKALVSMSSAFNKNKISKIKIATDSIFAELNDSIDYCSSVYDPLYNSKDDCVPLRFNSPQKPSLCPVK